MISLEEMRAWRDAQAAASTEKKFMGKPESWYENLHWFCRRGHVSGVFLKADDGDRCLVCREPVIMGPPIGEDAFLVVRKNIASRA